MREDSDTNRGTGQDLSRGARPAGASTRRRQAGFPFWVIRGSQTQEAPHPRPRNADAAPVRAGRTGVDLRAAGGAMRRDPPSAPRPQPPARRSLWRRRETRPRQAAAAITHPETTLGTIPAVPVGTVAEALATRGKRRRRIRVSYGLALLALVQVVVLGAIAWGLTSPTWQVRYVQVAGTQDATLIAAIQKLPLKGCNIFRCDTTRQTWLVEALPAVASAEVHAAYPDGLIVVVSARRPATLWHTGGQDIVVASDGTVLGTPASDSAYARATLPEVFDAGGAAFGGQSPQAGARMPETVVEMAGQLRSGMEAALGGSGWTLHYAADEGFVAVAPNGEQVVFGTPLDAASAAPAVAASGALVAPPDSATVDAGVRAQLGEVGGLMAALTSQRQKPSLIDVRWGTHPYYRVGG